MTKPSVKKLKNGMTVISVPQKGATSFSLMVMARVGSRYETEEINGASHFVEHLMFKGTKRRPNAHILTQEFDRFGSEYNAYTSKDSTAYYVKIDAGQSEHAVDLLHDMVFHSLYEPKEINRERGVILEEINMYEDNPVMALEDVLEEALFPQSTLGWQILGPRKVIKNITPKQLTGYRDTYYTPERVVVAMAGKIPPGTMKKVEATFGAVKSKAKNEAEEYACFCPPKNMGVRVMVQKKETEQTQLGIAFHGYAYDHKDAAAADLLGVILGGSMSSRLFQEIREKHGLCYTIRASHSSLEDTGIFSIMAGLDKKRIEDAVHAILKELKNVYTKPFGNGEIQRAKDHFRGRLMLAFEDSSFQARWYAKQWTFTKELQTPEERIRKVEGVTAADVKRVAKAIFTSPHKAVAAIGPISNAKTFESYFSES